MRLSRRLLGTLVEITIFKAPGGEADAAVQAAFDAMLQVERCTDLSCSRSDVSRINAAHGGETVAVHAWTGQLLDLAQELYVASGARFDCSLGSRPQRVSPREAYRAGSVLDVELLREGAVRVLRPVKLDLGCIARGFAVDRAIDALVRRGIDSAVVNAGGDLRVLGGMPRALHVRWPRAPNALVYLGDLAHGAAATSAGHFSPGDADPASPWPLLDPESGHAVAGQRSFTVLAPLCAVADGLTRAMCHDGMLAQSCLRRFDAQTIVL